MNRRIRDLSSRVAGAARGSGSGLKAIVMDGADGELLVVEPAAAASASKHILLLAGTHGDEPAGVEALVRFTEASGWRLFPRVRFTIYPCLNPAGYASGTRENGEGEDINRSFRGVGTAESRAIRASLGGHRFDYFFDMHEDVEQTGFYIYEMADGPLWAEAVVKAVAAVGPVLVAGKLEGDGEQEVRDGVVHFPRSNPELLMEELPDWPLTFFLRKNCVLRGLVAETPGKLHVDQRVEMQLAGLHRTLELLSQE